MPPLNILVKPASSKCNMRCKYCFYYAIASRRCVAGLAFFKKVIAYQKISEGILEKNQ